MAVESSVAQRIRYGLTGLAMVFLVVLLGAALRRVGEEQKAPPAPTVATDPNEPLAEIGAAPGQGSDNAALPEPAKPVRQKPAS